MIPPPLDDSPPLALELTGVNKRFGGTVALAHAGIRVRSGTVHALLGENGAGKTTLMRIAYGFVRADGGDIRIRGEHLRFATPSDAIAAGIGMVHQHFTLVPAMTVAENIALGGRGRLRAEEMTKRVEELAARTGFVLDPRALISDLSVGAQQRVEIAKALGRNAEILILDEPTAVLAPPEVEDLLRWLRAYAEEGRSAVLITHKLRDALAIADDVTVLRNGQLVFTGSAATVSVPQLTAAMLGSAAVRAEPPQLPNRAEAATPIIRADRMSVADASGRIRIREASFVVHAGERLGIAAIEGSGQRELLRALAGRMRISGGTLEAPEVVGFVPEDRHGDALLLDGTLVENVALRGAGRRRGRVSWMALRDTTSRLVAAHDIRAGDDAQVARTLSGGNQQKLVLARELEATVDEPSPRALVVENPTRGLDVNASAAIQARLRRASLEGAAIVLYSSDLDEVLALATRVIVVFDGWVVEVPSDRQAIGEAMLGAGVSSRSAADGA
ncbi:ABC transporter ATP-binding protein [soil metagenome]